MQQVCPDAQLVEWASMPEGEYRAFTVGSLFGRDRLECAPKCMSLRKSVTILCWPHDGLQFDTILGRFIS